MASHVFGPPNRRLGVGERLCNEPEIAGAKIDTIYHAHFDMLEDGNFRCKYCGNLFIEPEETS